MRRVRARGIVLCFIVALAFQIITPATLYAAPRPEKSPSVAAGPPLATQVFGPNVLAGLGATALKTNGDEGGWPRTNAADGSDATHWSGLPSQGSVANSWWAADLGDSESVGGYRIYSYNPNEGGVAQDIATETRIYGTNDATAWAALVHGSGKMTTDPAANGWTLAATQTNALVEPMDSGDVSFGETQTFRYWLFKAISGGSSEWDVNEFELFEARPDCDGEDLSTQIDPVGPDERVTVRYDPRFLVDPVAAPDFAGDTDLIAHLIKNRAEEALDYYGSLGLATPPAVTVEIKCQIGFWLVGESALGFTGSPDLVQLKAGEIELEFAKDVKNGFPADGIAWNAPDARWRGRVDHEMFHIVQWASSAPGGVAVRSVFGDHTWVESPAVLAQDLFADTDDLERASLSYLDEVALLAAAAGGADKPRLDTTVGDVLGSGREYWFGGALQYWAERFGPRDEPNLEVRAARFLDVLARSACCNEVVTFGRVIGYDWAAGQYGADRGAYGRAISALRDYYVAHFALRATNVSAQENSRYAILDAETGHGYPPGITPAGGVGAYPELVVRDDLDLTGGPDSEPDDLAASEADIFLIPVPAGTASVEFAITAGAADADADSAMRLAFVPIGDDGSMVVDPVLMPAGPQPGRSLTKTIGMVGRTALALVLVAGDRAVSYVVEARPMSGAVNVEIVDPTATNPYRVASPLEPMIVTARPTIDGDVPISLDTSSFSMTIGGLDADISSVMLRDGAYRIEANIPNSLGAGTHQVRLTYAGTEVDVPGGVTIDAAVPPREYQIGSVTSGPVAQGATTQTALVVAEGAGSASFSAEWLGSEFDLVLTAPSGRVIDEASTDPDVTVIATANTVEINVASPESGEWTLEARASDVPQPEPVTLGAAEAATPVHGELLVESGAAAGEPVTVSFALADDSSGVQEAAVIATLTDPNGQALRFELRDDGAHDDGGGGDGLYAITLWSTTVGGEYQIAVDATGSDAAGGQLMRHGSTAISLLPMVDTDGDGVSDAAESAFGTDPSDPSDAATDHDGDGLGLSAELGAGLDPRSWDTDGGGENDASELSAGRDPRLASDDAAVPLPNIGAQPADGGLVSVSLGTADGSGSVHLWRVETAGLVDLGLHPGSGVTLDEGPLPDGNYSYRAIGVATAGSQSSPTYAGPFRVAADVTPPTFRLVVNDGRWESVVASVGLRLAELSEQPAEIRVGTSAEALAGAPWEPFAAPDEISLPAVEGQHDVYAQVRDGSGNASAVQRSFVFLVDRTPPTSTAGPLDPTYTSDTFDVPYTASDDMSGVATATLWWRHRQTPTGAWSVWQAGPSSSTSPFTFVPSAGFGYYEFYSVATDAAGNIEGAPAGADASTQIPDPTRPWAWGRNASGELGSSTSEVCSSFACSTTPLQLGTLSNVVGIAAGANHSIALQADGTVWTWGDNGAAQLGNGTYTDSTTPVHVSTLSNVVAVAAGRWISLALRSDGTLWAWGTQNGGIGNGSGSQVTRPVQVTGLTNVIGMAAGDDHSLAVRADGTVWAWGKNTYGQLSGTKDRAIPAQVSVLTTATAVAAGGTHSLALTSGGAVYAWGHGAFGQLGLGSTQNKSRPTQISTLAGVTDIAAGSSHSLAILADGTVRAWGWNGGGQLGDGTTVQRLSPVAVAGMSGASDISAGGSHSLALAGGTVWGWGAGQYGQIDNGTAVGSLVPLIVGDELVPVSQIAAGLYHNLAIRGAN